MKPLNVVLASVVALAYAGCFVAIKLGLPYAPPLRFAGARALLAGGTLLVLSGVAGRGIVPPRRFRIWLPVLGAVLAIQYGAMFLSPARAGAGLSSVLANVGPIFLVVFAWLLLRERISRAAAGALLLGALGVAVIAWPTRASAGGGGPLGVSLPLTVALGAAVETVLLKRIEVGRALLPVAAWQLIMGGLPLLLASTLLEDRGTVWTPEFLASLAFLALPGTALGLALWYWLVQRESVSRLAAFMFLVPVAGLLLAWTVSGETVTALQPAGLALALLGIGLAGGLAGRSERRTSQAARTA